MAWFNHKYQWHPNKNRITQKVHEAAENLKDHGAREFHIMGLQTKTGLNELSPIPFPANRRTKGTIHLL